MTPPPNDSHRPDDAVPPAGAVGGEADGGPGAVGGGSGGVTGSGGAASGVGADGGPGASGGGSGGVAEPGGAMRGVGADASGGGSGGVAEPGGATRAGGPVAAHGAVDGAPIGAHRAAPGAPNRSRTMWLLIGAGVVALAVIVGLFFVGLRVGGGGEAAPVSTATSATTGGDVSGTATAGPTSNSTPPPTSPTPSPTVDADAAAPPGPLAPGVHDWNALHGGECLTGYTSPWELQFTVVDCAGDHNAQLVSKGAFAEDAAAPFPGEAELISRLNLLCTAPSVLDYTAAATVPDIQWQGAYPANDAQWAGGDRAYFCFFSRTSGEPLGASLAAPPAG